MKPVQFHYRYRFNVLFPDHVARVVDLSTHRHFYAVWQHYDKTGALTVLRTMFRQHEAAAAYATRFQARYIRLLVAQVVAEERKPRWWNLLAAWVIRWLAGRRRKMG